MRKLVGILALVLVVILGGFVYLNKDYLLGLGKKVAKQASGYTPAKTPDEAVDKFRKAIQNHDFETAAGYLGGDYAEQMQRGAKSASALAEEIGNLSDQMKQREKNSDQGQFILRALAPFPTEFEVVIDAKKKGDDKAVGVIIDKSAGGLKIDLNQLPKSDPIFHALFRYDPPGQPQAAIAFERLGSGNDVHWKIFLPMNQGIRTSVDRLNAKSADFVQALKKVKHDVMHEPMTGKDVETKLKTELEALGKEK
jgi:hypothetical protein